MRRFRRTWLNPQKLWLPLDEVVLETGGAKALGAKRLEQLSRLDLAGFKTAPSLVIPFGVMEQLLRSYPEMHKSCQEWLRQQTD